MTLGIYCITCTVNGKVYVGQAANIEKRFNEHKNHLLRGSHHSRHLQRAFNEYGPTRFEFKILERVKKEKLVAREQYWMDRLKAADRAHGFNHAPAAGSCLGVKRSRKTRNKLAESARKRWEDPEYAAKMAEIIRKRWEDPEHAAKMAEAGRNTARKRWEDPEHAAKMAEIIRKRWEDPEYAAKMAEARRNTARKQWEDPEYAAKMAEARRKQWEDPEYAAKMAEITRKRWEDPECRAKLLESRRAAAERRRQADLADALFMATGVRVESRKGSSDDSRRPVRRAGHWKTAVPPVPDSIDGRRDDRRR